MNKAANRRGEGVRIMRGDFGSFSLEEVVDVLALSRQYLRLDVFTNSTKTLALIVKSGQILIAQNSSGGRGIDALEVLKDFRYIPENSFEVFHMKTAFRVEEPLTELSSIFQHTSRSPKSRAVTIRSSAVKEPEMTNKKKTRPSSNGRLRLIASQGVEIPPDPDEEIELEPKRPHQRSSANSNPTVKFEGSIKAPIQTYNIDELCGMVDDLESTVKKAAHEITNMIANQTPSTGAPGISEETFAALQGEVEEVKTGIKGLTDALGSIQALCEKGEQSQKSLARDLDDLQHSVTKRIKALDEDLEIRQKSMQAHHTKLIENISTPESYGKLTLGLTIALIIINIITITVFSTMMLSN